MFWRLVGLATVLSGLELFLYRHAAAMPVWLTTALLLGLNLFLLGLAARAHQIRANLAEERLVPVDPTLRIAHETLPHLRRGLNEDTAGQIAGIIEKITDVAAVAITDREKVLAYRGVGCEHHHPGDRILTDATKQALNTGQLKIVQNSAELNCPVKNCACPLAAAVIVPLLCRDQVVGSLKLYQTRGGHLPPAVIRLATGIGQLLSMQLELAELDRQTQLVTLAQLDALHAQINPHFLFNTLNTIVTYSRTNPQRARRLLVRLAEFFRLTLKRHQGHFVTLREELESVHTYLALEKARFGKKLHILQVVPDELLDYQVPVLSLQPLVENAVKHGLSPKQEPGAVSVSARLEGDDLIIAVADDGVGIPADRLPLVLLPGHGSGNGVGLSNVDARLRSLFGESRGLRVESVEGAGTTITMCIPCHLGEIKLQGA